MKEFLPFALQGLLMGIDEFYCHRRRPLRLWERIGHPLDTLLFWASLAWLLIASPSTIHLAVFAGMAVASCLFITKDEWQHRELCTGFENWLHAVLFMLHPVLLIWSGRLWWTGSVRFFFAVSAACLMSLLFALYQSLYWNWWRHDQQ